MQMCMCSCSIKKLNRNTIRRSNKPRQYFLTLRYRVPYIQSPLNFSRFINIIIFEELDDIMFECIEGALNFHGVTVHIFKVWML
jgi:hypothetical protein